MAPTRLSDDSFTPNEKRTLAGVALAAGLRILGVSLILPVFALYQDGMKASTAEIGLALGIYSFTNAAFQVPLGFLSDRIGRKGVLLGGMLVFAIGSFMAAWAPTIWLLILARALQGSGAIGGVVYAMVADAVPVSRRHRAMAYLGIPVGAAFIVGMILGPLLAGAYGIPFLFALMGGLVLACGCYILLFIPEPEKHAAFEEVGVNPREIPFLLADRDLLRVNLGSFLMNFLMSALFLALPGLLAAVMPMAYFSLFYLPLVLVGVIVMRVLSRTADRKGGRAIAVPVFLLLALSPVLLDVAPRGALLPLIPGALLFFFSIFILQSVLPGMTTKIAKPAIVGTAAGVNQMLQALGSFAGAALAGAMLLIHPHAFTGLLVVAGVAGSIAAWGIRHRG